MDKFINSFIFTHEKTSFEITLNTTELSQVMHECRNLRKSGVAAAIKLNQNIHDSLNEESFKIYSVKWRKVINHRPTDDYYFTTFSNKSLMNDWIDKQARKAMLANNYDMFENVIEGEVPKSLYLKIILNNHIKSDTLKWIK